MSKHHVVKEVTIIKDKDLAIICNQVAVILLKDSKREVSLIIESFNKLDSDLQDTIKKLLKNQLHNSYNDIKNSILELVDNRDDFMTELRVLEEQTKKKL